MPDYKPREIGAADIEARRVADAVAYWRARIPPGRRFPGRADIEPTDIPALLPNVMLTDVLSGGGFRVRLFGTALAEMFGGDYTGAEPAAVPRVGALVHINLTKVVESRAPVYIENTLAWQEREFVRYQVAHLPLGQTDASVEIILTCAAPIRRPT